MANQPCLLDRLTDDDPRKSAEASSQRSISVERYREGVLRDLMWLFNASAHVVDEGNSGLDLETFPHANRSVINFGIRHLFGIMTPDMEDLNKRLIQALYAFEPRIIRNTLKVRARHEGNVIALEIQGELWGNPIQQLRLKTLLDIENGHATVST